MLPGRGGSIPLLGNLPQCLESGPFQGSLAAWRLERQDWSSVQRWPGGVDLLKYQST